MFVDFSQNPHLNVNHHHCTLTECTNYTGGARCNHKKCAQGSKDVYPLRQLFKSCFTCFIQELREGRCEPAVDTSESQEAVRLHTFHFQGV